MGFLGKSGGGPTVGVDVGSSLIKVVEARPGRDGIQITALGVGPTPPGAIDNEIIVDPQGLGQALRQLLIESGIKSRRSVSLISGQSCVVVRIIEVPKMTGQELAETMKWEVERHVPFAANEVIMDFKPVERPGAPPDDQSMEVLLAVAQQDVVNSHVDMLFAAGLEPEAIDVQPLAASRSLIDVSADGEKEQTVVIVNIGASSTDIGVFHQGVLEFPRVLPLAGDAITRAISDTLNIPLEQAERLKRERGAVFMERIGLFAPEPELGGPAPVEGYGPPNAEVGVPAGDEEADIGYIQGLGFHGPGAVGGEEPPAAGPVFDLSDVEEKAETVPEARFDLSDQVEDVPELITPSVAAGPPAVRPAAEASGKPGGLSDEAIFDAMAPVLHDLCAEIKRSLEYYVSRYRGGMDKLILCGGTAKLRDIDKFVSSELGMPVVIANPLKSVKVFSQSVSEDYLEEVAAIFPVSVGLAIRDMIGE